MLRPLLPLVLAGACAVGSLMPAVARAELISWNSVLTGSKEVPPNSSPARGTASGTFDTVTHVLTWDVSVTGLTSPATVGHFHGPARPGEIAPPIIDLNLGSLLGNTSGAFNGSADLDGDSALRPEFFQHSLAARIDELLADLWYVNVHTVQYPAGEIRGQVITANGHVPEPASGALLGLGLAAAGMLRRRRPA